MNTEVVLPLESMTVAEKIDVIEKIMADFAKNPESYPSPEWHGRVLAEREQALKDGKDQFISLKEAKKLISERTGWKS
ncbi:MAG: addiction module protein [Pyrinomonadaceae bacterium]